MDELLKFLVKAIVTEDEVVEVAKEEDERTITYKIKVAESDIGKVIGKNGKTATSIRTIMKSVGAKSHKKVFVKFED
ncbi:MAG: KH domain-containing protein [Clostridia bacterium]|nr:KH domain-containing protein [Clostridia bacterium]